MNSNQIARELNRLGIRCRGKRWHRETVRRIVQRELSRRPPDALSGPARCVLYARVSPRPTENESVLDQLRACRAWVDSHADMVIDSEYQDQSSSGADRKRVGLRQAVETVMRHKRSGVLVVYSLSRLTRDLGLGIDILDRLRRAGRRIYAVASSRWIVTDNPMEWLGVIMTLVMDHVSRTSGSHLTSQRMIAKQDNGHRMGGSLRYGLQIDPAKGSNFVAECPAETEVIKRIISMYDRGLSQRCGDQE